MLSLNKNKISNFLKQPYPFYYRGKELFLIAGLIFVMSLFFNYFFQPFDVYIPEHKMNYFLISLIHSSSPFVILLMLSAVNINPSIEENWCISKEIGFILLYLLLVGLAQFLIRDLIYDNPNNWSLRYLVEEIRNTILVGILFISILVPLNFNRLYAKNIMGASNLKTHHSSVKSDVNSSILIKTQLKGENLQLDVNNLLFAKAEGNYVELFVKDEIKRKVLKRITIKELESVLKPYPNIFKTHRSYLVNLDHIKNVTGNAQGYKLQLDNIMQKIPVSRNRITKFNKSL